MSIVMIIKLTPRKEQKLLLIVKIFKEEIVYAFNRFLFPFYTPFTDRIETTIHFYKLTKFEQN